MQNRKSIYGIIGNPVEHSLSPLMHNAAFRELGVNSEYRLFPLKEEELAGFFADLRKKDNEIFGFNVTVPYKEKVLEYMDSLNPFAQRARAVNCVIVTKDRLIIGVNTDGPGFLAHLTELKFDTKDKRIAILGAGGTTRAILSAVCLLPERPESVTLYNHHPEKANALIADLAERVDMSLVKVVNSIDDLNLELADLLINTTPVGMNPGDPLLVDPELLHPNMLVYDVIYRPAETKLLKTARQKGARTVNGLGMLYYQAVLSLQHWAGAQLRDSIKAKMRESLQQGSPR